VFVQTCTPDHPAITAATLGDPSLFLGPELEQRREAGYPPYTRLITLLVSGRDQPAVERAAVALGERLRPAAEPAGVTVLGPAPQALARLKRQHRWHLLLKGRNATALREVARAGLTAAESDPRIRGVRVVADVDPVEVL
jgi:primosomal protein N' (replication factor Y)